MKHEDLRLGTSGLAWTLCVSLTSDRENGIVFKEQTFLAKFHSKDDSFKAAMNSISQVLLV